MFKKIFDKKHRSRTISYLIVIFAYIILEVLLKTGSISSRFKSLLVPTTCYIVVAIALIGFGVYYFWPKSEEKDINSIGITYEQLVANYHSSVAYTGLFKDFNTELPEMTYVDNDSTNDKLNYFGAPITNGFTTYGLAIQGSERKSDKELCGLRVMFEVPSTPEEQEENIKIVFLFYDMIMNSEGAFLGELLCQSIIFIIIICFLYSSV